MSAQADVVLTAVQKRYGATIAVPNLDLTIPPGSFFSLLGPSGCGKTTTLRLIAGFERADRGAIRIGGRDVTNLPAYKRDFGMVFQNFALFPHMTVGENVAFGPRMKGAPRAEIGDRVKEALALVQLADYADRYPNQLSGGQQQRVALARAIVIRPPVLLLDEPLGALDKMLRDSMQTELRQLQKTLGITTVFVTHDQEEALTMSDAVAVMNKGVIEQIDSPTDIYERPKTEFVASFLGVSNIIDGRVMGIEGDVAIADCAGDTLRFPATNHAGRVGVGDAVRLVLRPEKVRLTAPDAPEARTVATVRDVVYKGSQTTVLLERRGSPLTAFIQGRTPAELAAAPGATLGCAWEDGSVVRVG